MNWITCPDGRRFRTYTASCLCAGTMGPCWQARCECGEALTRHDFTEASAEVCAREVMARRDPRPGFGHASCRTKS